MMPLSRLDGRCPSFLGITDVNISVRGSLFPRFDELDS